MGAGLVIVLPPRGLAVVLVDAATGERVEVYRDGPLREATLEWARFHGIDPMTVPAGSEVIRDEERCRVLYQQFVYDPAIGPPGDAAALVLERDEDGEPEPVVVSRVAQGEAPPLPFPR